MAAVHGKNAYGAGKPVTGLRHSSPLGGGERTGGGIRPRGRLWVTGCAGSAGCGKAVIGMPPCAGIIRTGSMVGAVQPPSARLAELSRLELSGQTAARVLK